MPGVCVCVCVHSKNPSPFTHITFAINKILQMAKTDLTEIVHGRFFWLFYSMVVVMVALSYVMFVIIPSVYTLAFRWILFRKELYVFEV